MKNIILTFSILLMYTACETGTKYEQNSTVKKKEIDRSILDLVEGSPSAKELINKSYIEENETGIDSKISHKYDPENPLNGDTLIEDNYVEEESPKKEESFIAGNIAEGLNVKSIRVGYHDTYTRLVFDIEKNGEKAKKAGKYNVDYDGGTGIVSVTLNAYSGFSAKFPTFSKKRVVEKMYFDKNPDDNTLKFSIKLRDSASVKSYDYKNPARLIIDIRPF